jgi:hypothetical protein
MEAVARGSVPNQMTVRQRACLDAGTSVATGLIEEIRESEQRTLRLRRLLDYSRGVNGMLCNEWCPRDTLSDVSEYREPVELGAS